MRRAAVLIACSAVIPPLSAATFVVPNDRALVREATAIVIASPLASHTEMDGDRIVTVTNFSVEETIEGDIGERLDVREPGGVYEDRALTIPGVPRFAGGDRYLLFLRHNDGAWHILDLVLGKFKFETDELGREVAIRDAGEIAGWDPDGTPHREVTREAKPFLEFIRAVVRGAPARQRYFVPAEPLIDLLGGLGRTAVNSAFSATSYTFILNNNLGGRWNVFPAPVNFFSVGTEPGAPSGGVTAINAGIAAWNGDPNSNVNYVYAGADTTGTHNAGISAPDGENTVSFERDLSSFGAAPFQCSTNGYSGTLGLGGITNTAGTHSGPNGETFYTAAEGDVEMNKGIANCTLLFNNGDFNSAVTHELGHTLGFRHSDQTRADNPSVPCTSDPTLECSNTAIMKSFVTTGLNATLQLWDQHAVDALYPGASVSTLSAPTGVTATAQTSTRVVVTWNAVAGATSYQIDRKAAGGSFVLIGTSASNSYTDTTVAPNSAYLYRVRAVNATGSSADSGPDLATTVIFTDDPLVPGVTVIKAVHLAEMRTAVNAVRALAGLAAATFTDPASPGVIVKAVHITQLRSALDQARSALGLSSGGWTDTVAPGAVIKAIDFQEIRNRVK